MDNKMEMGDSQQGKYKVWTVEESNELLKILVDAATHGWRDANGSFNKLTVMNKILPTLNAKLGCQRTFSQYQSRMKWFKNRYNYYCKLLRHSSGFGWDPFTKKFTASDEVWDDYIKSNGNSSYRIDTFMDYEDLKILIGNRTATGRNALGLGDDTDARTFDTEERIGGASLENFMYDSGTGAFVQSDTQEHLYESSFPENSIAPSHSQPMSQEVPTTTRKRNRSKIEAKSKPSESNTQSELLEKIDYTLDKLTNTIDSLDGRENTCWDIIKEIPDLDNSACFKALNLLNTKAKKFEFMK